MDPARLFHRGDNLIGRTDGHCPGILCLCFQDTYVPRSLPLPVVVLSDLLLDFFHCLLSAGVEVGYSSPLSLALLSSLLLFILPR